FMQAQQQACPVTPTGKPIPPPPEPKEKEPWSWVAFDYAFAFIRTPRTNVPLVTTSNQVVPRAGALDVPGTTILQGTNISHDTFSGVRAEIGTFLDCDRTCSVEASTFWLFPNHSRFSANSDGAGNPPILRPAFDVASRTELALIDALPGFVAGGVDTDFT